MISRIWHAYAVECAKATRMRQSVLGPLLILAGLLAALWVHPIHMTNESAYAYVAYSAPSTLNLLGFVLLLIFSASNLSAELASGTIRQYLVRPILRHEIVIAKLLLCMTYALLLTVMAAGGAWLIALVLGKLEGVTYGGELLYSAREMRNEYLLAATLNLAAQFAGAAVALLISAIARSSVAAITITLALWVFVDMVKYPLGIEQYIFTTWLEGAWRVFVDHVDGVGSSWIPTLWYCLGSSLIIYSVAMLLTVLIFHRRDCTG